MARLGGNRARALFQLMALPLGRSIVRDDWGLLSDDARRRTPPSAWSSMVSTPAALGGGD